MGGSNGKINTTTPIVRLKLKLKLQASRRGVFLGNRKWRRIGRVGNVGDQRRNTGRWAVRKIVMVITEGKAGGRCEKDKTIMKTNEAMT